MARRGTKAGIDLTELEKLCGLQCTDEEIGAWFNVTTRTIERRRKVMKFADVMNRGKAKGRISVRRQQMKLLEQGNATMGVWLGKNILGQTDEIRHQVSLSTHLSIVMPRPRSVDATMMPGADVARPSIEAGEAEESIEVDSADYDALSK